MPAYQGLCRPWEVCIWWEDIGEFVSGRVTSSDSALRKKKTKQTLWELSRELKVEKLGMARVSTEAEGTTRGNCRSTCNRQELFLFFPLGYDCFIMCSFLLHNEVNQLYVYMYSSLLSPAVLHLPSHPSGSSQSTELSSLCCTAASH